jgi:UDP-3-O-[3-hydroxymyristoyl] glucosamine N-acyltransferase
MKFPQPISVKTLAEWLEADLVGDTSLFAHGINEIHQVEAGDITFSDVAKYFEKSLKSAATIIFLNEKIDPPAGKCVVVCAQPFDAFDSLIRRFRPDEPQRTPISHTAEIDPTATLEPGVVVGNYVKIGKNTRISANSVIGAYSIIGDNCFIGANCSIGTDAFYYKKKADGSFQKWTTGGRVILENRVEIGPSCTLARGVTGDTIVGEGTKLDAQIQLGHEVKIGKNCLLAAQVGVGGNTIIGNNVVIYGQVGIAQNIVIGDGVLISAKSGVSKSLAGGQSYFGIPADESMVKYRELAALRQLPAFLKKG